jgi:hypothetical protein
MECAAAISVCPRCLSSAETRYADAAHRSPYLDCISCASCSKATPQSPSGSWR